MFTGIVEEMGTLRDREGGRFRFTAAVVLDGLSVGDSVAHNGCCLTAAELGDGWYRVDVVAETLARTNLGSLSPGDGVNLERAATPTTRLGGHIVQGHVDAVGRILRAAPDLEVELPAELARYVVAKGPIAVDGCSLTVVDVGDDHFSVAIVPHTASSTTLGRKAPGDTVNLEVDLMAKYVEKLLEGRR
ncbi:MAG: riboflavin synthase [Acidimicrobiales bacterium]